MRAATLPDNTVELRYGKLSRTTRKSSRFLIVNELIKNILAGKFPVFTRVVELVSTLSLFFASVVIEESDGSFQRQGRQMREKLGMRLSNHSLFSLRRADDSHDVIMIDKDQKRMGWSIETSFSSSLSSVLLGGQRLG